MGKHTENMQIPIVHMCTHEHNAALPWHAITTQWTNNHGKKTMLINKDLSLLCNVYYENTILDNNMNLKFSVGFLNYLLQTPILSLAIVCNNELAKQTEGMSSSKICIVIISK